MFAGLRKNAKIVIYIIAGVFILSMGIGGISSMLIPKNHLGKIAGEVIEVETYQAALSAQHEQYYAENPGVEMTEQKQKELENQAWTRLTQSIILNKAIKKRRIKVTTDDVIAKLQDPPEYLTAMEQFQTDGVFDKAKYDQMLLENDNFAAYLEQSIRSSLPMEKLYDSVKAEVVVTEEDVKDDYIKNNNLADAQIVYFNPNKVKDIESTEEEEKVYYENNKEDYKKDPARKYKYIKIPLKASEADIATVKVEAMEIYKKVVDGMDFAKAAQEYSQGPSAPRGGDLGKFTRGRMVKEFSDAAFTLEVGGISEPVLTQFGWHIIKVYEKGKNDKDEEEIAARHILLNTDPSEETKVNLATIAEDIYAEAKKGDLDEIAKNYAYEAKETTEFYKDGKYISGLGQKPELVEFAFSHKEGAMPELISEENGEYTIAKISLVVGEHYQDFADAQRGIKNKVLKEKKLVEAKKQAAAFAAKYQVDQYAAKAAEEGWEVVDATNVKAEGSITTIGKDEDLNAAILAKNEGENTGVVSTDRAAYIAVVTKRVQADMAKFEKEKEALTASFTETKENDYLNEWYMELLENANIEDNRSDFF